MELIKKAFHQPLRRYVLRLLAGLFPVLASAALYAGGDVTAAAHNVLFSFPLFLCVWAAFFMLTCLLADDRAVFCLLTAGAALYCCVTAAHAHEALFSLGACAALFLLVRFFEAPAPPRLKRRDALWWAIAALILCYTVYVGGLCCLSYRRYRTPCYDFGLFAQMFYYMKETDRCLITCERDRLLSHFAVHFSPIYYLFLPAYALFPTPETLMVLQPLTVAGAAVPLALLCRKKGLSDLAALAFAVCLLLYPGFLGGCFWYLHENCFLTPLLMWLLYFMERRKMLPAFAFALLTLLVKEDAAVYVAVAAAYFLFAEKYYKCSIPVLVFAVGYFIAVTKLMGVYGEGVMDTSRYGNYIYDGGGLFSMVKAVLMNPAYAVREIFTEEKLVFTLQMLVPLGMLPLAAKRPARLVCLIPLLLVNLMTRYVYQYDIGYQYTFGSGALLFYMAISNYADLGPKRGRILLAAVLSSAVLFSGGYAAKANGIRYYAQEREERAAITEALELIPPDADVAASTFLLANLSQRETVYELERTSHSASYIAMDLRFRKENTPETFLSQGYALLYLREGTVAVLYKENNP